MEQQTVGRLGQKCIDSDQPSIGITKLAYPAAPNVLKVVICG